MDNASEFPWHAGAKNFIAHHRPLIAGAFVELTANALAIFGSVLGGTFFLIQWLRRRRQNSNEAEFRKYLTSVLEIEGQLLQLDSQASVNLGQLVHLHESVVALKREVARRFFSGELDGQALMLGFMTMANDVRSPHLATDHARARQRRRACAPRSSKLENTLARSHARDHRDDST